MIIELLVLNSVITATFANYLLPNVSTAVNSDEPTVRFAATTEDNIQTVATVKPSDIGRSSSSFPEGYDRPVPDLATDQQNLLQSYQTLESLFDHVQNKEDQLKLNPSNIEPRNHQPSHSGCSPVTNVLLKLLSILLEFLNHTPEVEKGYKVLTLLKQYLGTLPRPLLSNELLLQLKSVDEHLLNPNGKNAYSGTLKEYFDFPETIEGQTLVVFKNDLPGLKNPACRPTFSKILQTAVDVYKDVALSGQCQLGKVPNTFESNTAPTTEPHLFEIFYPKEPSSPTLPVPQSPIDLLPYLPNQSNDEKPLDVVKLLLQYPQLLPSQNNPFDTLNPSQTNPYFPSNPSQTDPLLPSNPPQTNPVLPLNPSQVEPSSPLGPPDLNTLIPLNPSEYSPLGPFNPPDKPSSPSQENMIDLEGPPNNQNNVPPPYLYNQLPNTYPQNPLHLPQTPAKKPVPAYDILVKLLIVLGNDIKNGSKNPLILPLLLKYLKNLKENNLQAVPNSPEKEAISKFLTFLGLLPKTPDKNALDALTTNFPWSLTNTNPNKLDVLPHDGYIELTYILKRPQPIVYHPTFYVKYRLPYKMFMQIFKELISKKPQLKANPAQLYQELLELSNVTHVSPELSSYAKEDVLKLIFSNGALIDAKLVEEPSNKYLNEQLELLKGLNANISPELIGLDALNYLNKSNAVNNSPDNNDPIQDNLAESNNNAVKRLPIPEYYSLDEPDILKQNHLNNFGGYQSLNPYVNNLQGLNTPKVTTLNNLPANNILNNLVTKFLNNNNPRQQSNPGFNNLNRQIGNLVGANILNRPTGILPGYNKLSVNALPGYKNYQRPLVSNLLGNNVNDLNARNLYLQRINLLKNLMGNNLGHFGRTNITLHRQFFDDLLEGDVDNDEYLVPGVSSLNEHYWDEPSYIIALNNAMQTPSYDLYSKLLEATSGATLNKLKEEFDARRNAKT